MQIAVPEVLCNIYLGAAKEKSAGVDGLCPQWWIPPSHLLHDWKVPVPVLLAACFWCVFSLFLQSEGLKMVPVLNVRTDRVWDQ